MAASSQGHLRLLREEEATLIRTMLTALKHGAALISQLGTVMVEDMPDGGMGSLRFGSNGVRSLGAAVVEADYVDADGVPVSIVVNVDQNGKLLELDIWKVNFFPLERYPSPQKIKIRCQTA